MSNNRRKILFVCTEDWFFQSHFLPLGEAVMSHGNYDAAILATISGAHKDLERRGLTVLPVNFLRSSRGLFAAIKLVKQLIVLMRRERPDIIHFIALKPILLGGLAALFAPKAATLYHLTGLGFMADGKSIAAKLRKNICFGLIGFFLKKRRSWLIVENPDDLAFMSGFGAPVDTRASMFGGAGVDPEYFSLLPACAPAKPRAGYVGRMIWSKGVDVLVEAKNLLADRGIELDLDMFGAPDPANPHAIRVEILEKWNQRTGVNWHGPISDVRDVWRACEIAVIPTRTREGMPRAMLEAAACGRALIVSDVPGCRQFVRDGVEGLIVPPEDALSLAAAMEKLALDPKLRRDMGVAARKRVLEGYTEHHVREAVLKIYETLLAT